MTASDADLVRGCLAGDDEAFRALVERHERPVFHLIWRMVSNSEDARDLTQETFVRTFRALDQFDLNRTFSFWINRIAANLTIDFLRKKKQMVSLDSGPEDEPWRTPTLVDGRPSPYDDLERRTQAEHLGQAVERLAPHYRIVVHLRYVQQRSHQEISEMLDLPIGTVKARLHRAHHQLREILEGPVEPTSGKRG